MYVSQYPPRRRFSSQAFAAAHPSAAFLILVFSIAYPLTFLQALVQHGLLPGKELIDRLPMDPDELAGLTFTLLALLPSAVYVTWATEGRDGLRRLSRRLTRWRFGIGWWEYSRPARAGAGKLVGGGHRDESGRVAMLPGRRRLGEDGGTTDEGGYTGV